MVPDLVEFCEALPKTSTGKIDRAGLATESSASTGRAKTAG
jgi:acyl-coenzyme A synthetase/AMP-(fatty) acid ligase